MNCLIAEETDEASWQIDQRFTNTCIQTTASLCYRRFQCQTGPTPPRQTSAGLGVSCAADLADSASLKYQVKSIQFLKGLSPSQYII